MIKIKVFLIFIIYIVFFNTSNAQIKIEYKIGDKIVTNIDISDEVDYLIFLRPNLKNLTKEEIKKIAENSIIREIIKKEELNKIFKDLDNEKIIDGSKKSLFRFKKVTNENEFLNLLIGTNIKYDKIIQKMKYELMWNELIVQKYSSFIKIDRDKLKKELALKISNDKKFEYNLSEILFELEDEDNIDDKYKNIIDFVKINDFKIAASKYSIADSSIKGGQIGWIKETLLSKNLNTLLSKMKKNEISKPIKYPNGYLILKINDKKEMKQIISIDKELEELINFEKNRQLNQFSLLFYKKLKQNVIINEY